MSMEKGALCRLRFGMRDTGYWRVSHQEGGTVWLDSMTGRKKAANAGLVHVEPVDKLHEIPVFDVGDILRCIDVLRRDDLVEGKEYVVKQTIKPAGVVVLVGIEGPNIVDRFEATGRRDESVVPDGLMAEQIKETNEQTMAHVERIRQLLVHFARLLMERGLTHDQSKTEEPELSTFIEYTPRLKTSEYGSEEYKGFLAAMKPALDNHYAKNRHHPEHFGTVGVRGMNLIDLLEMFIDWKCAGERHIGGDIAESICINRERFGLSDELVAILNNTIPLFQGCGPADHLDCPADAECICGHEKRFHGSVDGHNDCFAEPVGGGYDPHDSPGTPTGDCKCRDFRPAQITE